MQPEEIFDFALNNLGDQAYDIIQNSGIIFNWASEDPMGVLVKMESLPASGFKQNVFWRVIWQWADDSPRQILERLELVPEPHRVHAQTNRDTSADENITQRSGEICAARRGL